MSGPTAPELLTAIVIQRFLLFSQIRLCICKVLQRRRFRCFTSCAADRNDALPRFGSPIGPYLRYRNLLGKDDKQIALPHVDIYGCRMRDCSGLGGHRDRSGMRAWRLAAVTTAATRQEGKRYRGGHDRNSSVLESATTPICKAEPDDYEKNSVNANQRWEPNSARSYLGRCCNRQVGARSAMSGGNRRGAKSTGIPAVGEHDNVTFLAKLPTGETVTTN